MPPEPIGDSSDDPKPVTATLQVVLVMLALLLVIGLAGIPGLQPTAGNGTLEMKQGWAAQHASEVAEQDPAGAATEDGSQEPADAPR